MKLPLASLKSALSSEHDMKRCITEANSKITADDILLEQHKSFSIEAREEVERMRIAAATEVAPHLIEDEMGSADWREPDQWVEEIESRYQIYQGRLDEIVGLIEQGDRVKDQNLEGSALVKFYQVFNNLCLMKDKFNEHLLMRVEYSNGLLIEFKEGNKELITKLLNSLETAIKSSSTESALGCYFKSV